MARERKVIETVRCDICGREADGATGLHIGWGKDTWEIDLCARDLAKIERSFDALVAAGRLVAANRRRRNDRPSRPTAGERERRWAILGGLGYQRHPGRLSAEETAALAGEEISSASTTRGR